MKQFRLHLTALDQLVITDGSSEGMSHQTLDYIPGNMLLGAFAEIWKKQHPGEKTDGNPEFEDLFLNGAVKWGNACPDAGDRPTVPLPLSFQKIKNYSGLPYCGDDDLSTCRVCNLLQFNDGENIKECAPEEWGLKPDEAIKLKKLDSTFIDPVSLCQSAVGHMWNTHVAMERRMAAESQLFGYSSICAGVNFSSQIICLNPDREEKLKTLLSSCERLRVGHSRSAGYGNVSSALLGVQETETVKFSQNEEIHNVFLCSHYTPALGWQTPLEGLLCDLRRLFRDDTLQIIEHKQFCSFVEVAGYNSLQRVPRRTRQCIGAGSIVQVKTSSIDCAGIWALGGSTAEGFGRFMIDPDFLKAKFPKPSLLSFEVKLSAKEEKAAPEVERLVHAITRRTLGRIAMKKAIDFVSTKEIRRFLTESPNMMKKGPKASQRGNLRMMVASKPADTWLAWFKELMNKDDKLPVVMQWKNSYAKWKGSTATLEEIMFYLL